VPDGSDGVGEAEDHTVTGRKRGLNCPSSTPTVVNTALQSAVSDTPRDVDLEYRSAGGTHGDPTFS
jgi:hypothetical protein